MDEFTAFEKPIKVTLALKDRQCVGEDQWNFTFKGTPQIVANKWVIYRTSTLREAIRSFEESEVKSIWIEKVFEG